MPPRVCPDAQTQDAIGAAEARGEHVKNPLTRVVESKSIWGTANPKHHKSIIIPTFRPCLIYML